MYFLFQRTETRKYIYVIDFIFFFCNINYKSKDIITRNFELARSYNQHTINKLIYTFYIVRVFGL